MDFNLGQIFGGGLVPDENNMALNYLSYFFSKGIVFGGQSGEDASVYMVLLGSLSVFYLAISLAIIVFLSAQKAYLTARDKEYAGQEDKNKLFALLMVLVMMMLAPVPGHNGLSLCQYISIKLFKTGSNIADWTAVKFLNLSSMTGNGATVGSDGKPEQSNIRYYAFQRFIDSTAKFNCAKALVAHNYLDASGSTMSLSGMTASNLYRDLRSECGLPYTMVDVEYPTLREKMSASVVARIDQENERSQNNPTYLKEMGCYKQEYAKLIGLGYLKVDRTSSELRLTPRFQDAAANKTIWQGIAQSSAECLLNSKVIYQDGLGNYVKAQNLSDADSATSTDSNPVVDLKKNPQGGWVALGDHFDSSREVGNEGGVNSGVTEQANNTMQNILDYDIESKRDPISAPLMAKLDSKLQVNVATVNASFKQLLAKVTQDGWLNWNPTTGPGGDADAQGVLKNVGGIILFAGVIDEVSKVFLPGKEPLSLSLLRKFGSEDVLKKPGALRGLAKIKAISQLSMNVTKLNDLSKRKQKDAKEMVDAANGLPWIGGAAKTAMFLLGKAMSIANTIFTLIASVFETSSGKLLIILLTCISILSFLPKVILGYALFVWLYECVLFVFVAPLGITIALLPKTRIGHDTWKKGLAIMLKPFLYVMFFIISIILVDISCEFAWDILMGGYNFSWSGGMELFLELLNGTLLLKLIAFLAFYGLVFIFSMAAILRGPENVLEILGIRSSYQALEGVNNEINKWSNISTGGLSRYD